ncbi:MAG: R3H domain-containing nucleic acid-binding protein [bacterium]|nr:R3H domain-containing nucleic acid-binding protein [bacterium]
MQENISQKISALIGNMGIVVSVDAVTHMDSVTFSVKSPDAALLIGENGTHLKAINHIIRRIVDKEFGFGGENKSERIQFIVDVNDYHKQRADQLYEIARMSAQRVRYFKKELEMTPMSPFERRIIHTALMEYPDIATESRGEGEERRVVIKPL